LENQLANPAWTYSQLDSFESCPKKFYHTKVKRDVIEPPTVHTEWGTKVHTAFENFMLTGELLPEGMQQWQQLAYKLADLPGEKLTEKKYAIDKDFQPCDWKKAWTRGIADLVVVHKDKAAVIDYKTGKRKPTEQLDLYANYIFHYHPEVNYVSTGFVWLKERKVDWNVSKADKKPFARDEMPMIWQGFLPRVRKLESAYERDSWPAKTSGLCKAWCPVTSCKFNGKYTHEKDGA
jgi:CRISPR/Cas system-associated exonuclease Cas4 (RecB family)